VQLFGSYVGTTWKTGLLSAAVRKASQQAELLAKYSDKVTSGGCTAKWIVLDGELNPAWIDGVYCLMTEPYTLCAVNSDITTLHGQFQPVILLCIL